MRNMAKYIVMYVRHPAIAYNIIENYDGKHVKFKYKRREDSKIKYYDKTMEINEFIEALIKFIPPKNFKMVIYYGIYSRRNKIDLKKIINLLVRCYGDLSVYYNNNRNKKRKENENGRGITCPFCGKVMKLVEIYYYNDNW